MEASRLQPFHDICALLNRPNGREEQNGVMETALRRADSLAAGGRPDALRLAAMTLAADLLCSQWLDAGWTRADLTDRLGQAADAAGVDRDCFLMSVAVNILRDPLLLELPPSIAIESELDRLAAFAPVDGVSLWVREHETGLVCRAHADGEPPLESEVVARMTVDSEAGSAVSDDFQGVPVLCWDQPRGALVARFIDAEEGGGLLLLEQAALMLRPLIERADLLEQNAERERSLVAASERRLTRLGFDIHDETLQDVALIAAETARLRMHVASLDASERPKHLVLGHVDDLEARLEALEHSLRSLCRSVESGSISLRPIRESVENEVQQLRMRSDVEVELAFEGDFDSLSDSKRIAMVRIVQECLSNVREHSSARRVVVSVRAHHGTVRLTVSDDGRGFDVERGLVQAARRGRLGLVGVHERARLLGGACEVSSRPGGPTTVAVVLPAWDGAAAQDASPALRTTPAYPRIAAIYT